MALRYKAELGQAIARRREELDLTQRELADRIGIKEPQTVSRWERGLNAADDLDQVAEALETTVAALLAGIVIADRAVAKRLGLAQSPHPPSSQLDRIEASVTRIEAILGTLAADQLEQQLAQEAQHTTERTASNGASEPAQDRPAKAR